MKRQKWSNALDTAAQYARIAYNLPAEHPNPPTFDLEASFLRALKNGTKAEIMVDQLSKAVCVEIKYEDKTYAGAFFDEKLYFEKRLASPENEWLAFFTFYAVLKMQNKTFDKSSLLKLEDSQTRGIPWEPLSFVSTPTFARNLEHYGVMTAGEHESIGAVIAVFNPNIVISPIKFSFKSMTNNVFDVKDYETTDWSVRDKDSYNKYEKERIANNTIVDGYVPTREDKLFVQRIFNSIKNRGVSPSFFLYGPAGTGKSEKGKYFSKMTGIPYTFICCSAMTNESDLRGKPNKLSTTGPLVKFAKRLVENFWGREIETSDIDNDNIQYSLTELVLACRYGWIIEIQEPSLIINAGTLGFLNCVLDNNRTLILPNGEQIPIHPNTTFIFTTNVDYEGCNPFNLSLLSRIGYVKRIDAPSEQEQVDRVISVTGYKGSRSDVEKVVQAVSELQNIISDEDISQGIADIRGAIDLINDYQYNGGSLRQSASITIEDKASLEPGYEEDIKLKLDSILGEV